MQKPSLQLEKWRSFRRGKPRLSFFLHRSSPRSTFSRTPSSGTELRNRKATVELVEKAIALDGPVAHYYAQAAEVYALMHRGKRLEQLVWVGVARTLLHRATQQSGSPAQDDSVGPKSRGCPDDPISSRRHQKL